MTTLTHKEMTAHIRSRIKAEGIPANVKMLNYCQVKGIAIYGKTYETRFTSEQCREIALIAQVNHLTKARGGVIDLDLEAQLTDSNLKHFEFHC